MINYSAIQGTVGALLRFPLRLIPQSTILPILQGPMRGMRWRAQSSNHGCWLGSYEKEKQDLFVQYVKRGDVVYDLGANVGFYSLLASKLVGESGSVIAFEPVPENLRDLRAHLGLNRIQNVTVYENAVSDCEKQVSFALGENAFIGRIADRGELTVSCVALDALRSKDYLPPPTLIKIDIEGAEVEALEGMKETLRIHHPVLFLATHGPALHRQCVRFLEALGYKLTLLGGDPLITECELLAI